jgi:RHS repeat-associated protein
MSYPRIPARRSLISAFALVCGASMIATRGDAATQTITTTYTRNADGALTAVTTEVGGESSTLYVTWDDFTPSAGAPGTGTVTSGDGNLVGIGPSPGAAQFKYDVRDRLTDCSPGDGIAAAYAYDAMSLMSSSTTGSDALQFYYDNAGAPAMMNTRQPSTGALASFLGPVRYLSSGTEQVLLAPRKDIAATYDATAQSLAAYGYDPYGTARAGTGVNASAGPGIGTSTAEQVGTSSYDLADNPFRYAGEYQDPTCRAYYLRARWYLPEVATFVSRDRADPVHRYGYAGGDPIGRIDPTGLKFTGADFTRDVDKAVDKLTPGVWAYVEPVLPVWGQALGSIQLLGLLPSFFHHPTAEGLVTFGFLGASVVAEAAGELEVPDRLVGPSGAFRARVGSDVVLGGAQTFAQSYHHRRIDVAALVQGIEGTAAGIFWSRYAGGHGYRPFNLNADDVADLIDAHFEDPPARDVLVFRVRYPAGDSRFSYTSPLLERLHAGVYDERTVAVSGNWFLINGLAGDDDDPAVEVLHTRQNWRVTAAVLREFDPTGQYAYIGRIAQTSGNLAHLSGSPLGLPAFTDDTSLLRRARGGTLTESPDAPARTAIGRACQRHAAAIRRGLGL